MTSTTTAAYPTQLAYVPARAGTLYDVMELILDRGMVIDVFVRVSLVGIEILKIDARVVVASVDTYLRFAEACNRLDLESDTRSRTVPELFGAEGPGGVKGKAAKKAVGSAGRKVREAITGGSDEEDEEEDGEQESSGGRRAAKSTASKSTASKSTASKSTASRRKAAR